MDETAVVVPLASTAFDDDAWRRAQLLDRGDRWKTAGRGGLHRRDAEHEPTREADSARESTRLTAADEAWDLE